MNMNGKRQFIVNCLFYVLLLALLYFGLKYVAVWLLPFIIGFCFAALANALTRRITGRKRRPGKFLSVLTALLILLLIAGAVGALIFFLSRQVEAFFQQYVIDGHLLESIQTALANLDNSLPAALQGKLLEAIRSAVSTLAGKLPSLVGSVVAKMPSILLAGVISVIASLFITAEYEKVCTFLKGLVPRRLRRLADAVSDIMRNSVLKFLRAYFLILCITFAEVTVGLLICGVKFPVGIAAITALIDILPVFGLGFVLWPWSAYCFAVGDYRLAISLLVLYAIVQIVRQFIEPRLVGRSIGMHPLLTLVSMYVGLKVFGAVGLFALPILVLIIKNLNDNGTISVFRSAVRRKPQTDGDPPAPEENTETKEDES